MKDAVTKQTRERRTPLQIMHDGILDVKTRMADLKAEIEADRASLAAKEAEFEKARKAWQDATAAIGGVKDREET